MNERDVFVYKVVVCSRPVRQFSASLCHMKCVKRTRHYKQPCPSGSKGLWRSFIIVMGVFLCKFCVCMCLCALSYLASQYRDLTFLAHVWEVFQIHTVVQWRAIRFVSFYQSLKADAAVVHSDRPQPLLSSLFTVTEPFTATGVLELLLFCVLVSILVHFDVEQCFAAHWYAMNFCKKLFSCTS
jgi:hypothetical protein